LTELVKGEKMQQQNKSDSNIILSNKMWRINVLWYSKCWI